MQHRDAEGRAYWQQPQVAELPFAIAVGAFHNDHAYWHPMSLVAEYLYGRRAVLACAADGSAGPIIEQIEEHHSACGYRAGSIWNRGFSSVTPIPPASSTGSVSNTARAANCGRCL
jgi:hypothetical protein